MWHFLWSRLRDPPTCETLHPVKRLAAALITSLALLSGCAHSDRAMLVTEEGLRAAETAWDGHFNEKADECEAAHKPETPEMEECFGATYDADLAVDIAIRSAVALLRSYWTARAQGETPDRELREILEQVQQILNGLPPEALMYFRRVTGL